MNRLLLPVVLCAVGLGSALALPRKPGVGEAGIKLDLPNRVDDWIAQDSEVTQRERDALAKDTEFARKMYSNSFGDRIFVSIVLSGFDMNNSIHRPERCLPAQGWNVMASAKATVPLADGSRLDTTRLFSAQPFKEEATGKVFTVRNFNYYWFVGSRDVTADHTRRTLYDIRDRVLYGQNQRWAYVTVASNVTEGLVRFGGKNEADTQKMVEDFIGRIAPAFRLTPEAK